MKTTIADGGQVGLFVVAIPLRFLPDICIFGAADVRVVAMSSEEVAFSNVYQHIKLRSQSNCSLGTVCGILLVSLCRRRAKPSDGSAEPARFPRGLHVPPVGQFPSWDIYDQKFPTRPVHCAG